MCPGHKSSVLDEKSPRHNQLCPAHRKVSQTQFIVTGHIFCAQKRLRHGHKRYVIGTLNSFYGVLGGVAPYSIALAA